MRTTQRRFVLWALPVIIILVVGLYGARSFSAGSKNVPSSAVEFGDVRKQSEEFARYNKSIVLTPEQEAVRRRALSALPAPCCNDKTAYTCCCSCNMAETWWGLSKHLIAQRGFGEEDTRAAVAKWFRTINRDGFSGDSCYTGRCNAPFSENGCGGMDHERVIY